MNEIHADEASSPEEVKASSPEEVEATSSDDVEALPVEPITPDPHSLGLELSEDPDETIGLLLREVATARDEAGTYLNDLKRVAADFENYRKRSLRERTEMLNRATEKVVTGLMPILDTFDAALDIEPESDTERQMYSGMINTREQLLKSLQAEGLEVVPTIGEEFDPEIHEPVGAPAGEGTVIVSQELRRGYRLNGRVLRAALVVLEVKQ
jgi:molecular chaperone GrpE